MENINYAFGAGGFKLGDRVEILTTKQRGILIGESIHLSGCNAYQVLLPVVVKDDKMTIRNCDYLILRKLEPYETVFGKKDNLTEENIFNPTGKIVDVDLIKSAMLEDKEAIPEIDEAVGIEEITTIPGTQVWHKVYGRPMVVIIICRNIYQKELEYGLQYLENDIEYTVFDSSYALLPMEHLIDIYTDDDGKTGPMFDDTRSVLDKRPLHGNIASPDHKTYKESSLYNNRLIHGA